MLIDIHVHMFSDHIAKRALKSLSAVCPSDCCTDGTVAGTEEKLRSWGVDAWAALNIATKPTQQRVINDWAASVQNKSIYSFGSVHPDAPDAAEEVYRIKSLGLSGVKLHPDYQDFFIDDPKVFPIYQAISETGLPVIFHTGRDPLSPDLVHASPAAVAQVLKLFPHMTVIAAHMGGMKMFREVEEHLLGKNIYFDTAMSALLCPPQQFEQLVNRHGAERVLFGSDCPWSRACDQVDYIERSKLTGAQKEKIYWKNAAELLKIQ
ncbi:amidohydrolase family protein [Caproiciproducens faecalis]|uniref:Amidohydrolase n=1 Tax=Caproiciproducens faecalis TaxID=2820301 RepID=A0ABS7DNB1_9FIRM|nr:amidohydrolase family protein [Caproiciproducens faecalis]MBW7572026.1 amidohydrolase [Caproiciproducens faecalis]